MNAPRKAVGPLLRRTLLAGLASAALLAVAPRRRRRPRRTPGRRWRRRFSTDRPSATAAPLLAIDAPYRAEDAALVPVGLHSLPPDDDTRQHSPHHAGDRPEPVAARGRVLAGREQRHALPVHAGARRRLHQRPRRGGTQRRPTLRDAAVRQGGRRMLGAGRARVAADSIPLGTMRFRRVPVRTGRQPCARRRC